MVERWCSKLRDALALIAKAVREANKIDQFGWIGGLDDPLYTFMNASIKLLTAHRNMVCVRSPVLPMLVIFNAISIDSWTNHDHIDWFNLSLNYSYMGFDYSYLNLMLVRAKAERGNMTRCTNMKLTISRLQFYLTLYSVLLSERRLGCKILLFWREAKQYRANECNRPRSFRNSLYCLPSCLPTIRPVWSKTNAKFWK